MSMLLKKCFNGVICSNFSQLHSEIDSDTRERMESVLVLFWKVWCSIIGNWSVVTRRPILWSPCADWRITVALFIFQQLSYAVESHVWHLRFRNWRLQHGAAGSAYLTTVSARVQSYTKSLRGPLGPKLRDSAFHKSPTRITGMTLGAAQLCSKWHYHYHLNSF